jgi:hypothetical protein
MPVEPGSGQFPHLRFERVPDIQPDRRTRSGFSPRKPPTPSNRATHAQQVEVGFAQAATQVSTHRRQLGIDHTNLFVLEFDSINLDLREVTERYQAWIVEEYSEKQGEDEHYRFLVQFPTEVSRQQFTEDLQLYKADSGDRATLPQGKRRNFFDALQRVRTPSRDERMGVRLRQEGLPTQDSFYVDVDLWHPPSETETRAVLGQVRAICTNLDGAICEEVKTSSLLLLKIRSNRQLAEALMDLDLVARIDLPPRLAPAYSEIFNVSPPVDLPIPAEDDPIACVVDSGVVSGHPFLRNWIIEEHDFDSGEETPVDLNGHGTAVAGLVVYGSVAECLESHNWVPKVRICSAKVLRNDSFNQPVFPEEHRVEAITEEAIRYFAKERKCKVFNLSLGIEDEVYANGRQFAWAEKLDELARELDIVIVISSGNRSDPPIPEHPHTREQFQSAVRDNLLNDLNQRLCNPATAALAITVGAIASSEALGLDDGGRGVRLQDAFAGAPKAAPTPFTRVGPGYASNTSYPPIKPEFVDYGGNYALHQIAGGNPRWTTHINLGEPTLALDQSGRFISARTGTSFAAPHMTFASAMATTSLEAATGRTPSANLIRALVGSATELPPCPDGWLGDEKDNETEILRLVGYGKCSVESLFWSKQNQVRLIATDAVEENKMHFYRIEIPDIFLKTRGRRGITLSLAYDPPVRASRRAYLARTMTVDAYRGLTTEQVELYCSKQENQADLRPPSCAELKFTPSKSKVHWSTLQVRKITWTRKPLIKTPNGEESRTIHVVVRCQQRFPTGEDEFQKYGLVVVFWHENTQIELYQALQNQVTLRATRIRV